MPRMGGEETLVELRRLHSTMPVLLCSGYGKHLLADGLVGRGNTGFLKKPYDLDAMRVKLREVLDE